MVREIENGFEVLTGKGKFLRSYHVTPNMDLVKTTNKIKMTIRSSSTMSLINEWLEIYRHQETVKDHLNSLK